MTDGAWMIELARCGGCRAPFLPTDGPCPRCGSTDTHLYTASAHGTVLAATELVHPAAGWGSPHLLAFVELSGEVRLLAIVDGPLPGVGSVVTVRREGEVYHAHLDGPPPEGRGDGAGEEPRVDGSEGAAAAARASATSALRRRPGATAPETGSRRTPGG